MEDHTTQNGQTHNRALRADIHRATLRVEETVKHMTPSLSGSVCEWMRKLSGTPHPEDYFLHPEAFPMFLLPYWVEKATGARTLRQFRRDLVHSTVNGYYYVRMLDDLMDDDAELPPPLLPAMHVFLYESIRLYMAYFPPDHPFWPLMRAAWFQSAESASHDILLDDTDATAFVNIAAQKVCACKIPIAAVCYYYGRPDLIPPWTNLTNTLGCWHQMLNDLFDWRKDLEHGNSTYFLSEGRRRARPRETTAEWVIRDGFQWGVDELDRWMRKLQTMAVELHSPGLSRYLRTRKALLASRLATMAQPVQALQQLVAAIQASR